MQRSPKGCFYNLPAFFGSGSLHEPEITRNPITYLLKFLLSLSVARNKPGALLSSNLVTTRLFLFQKEPA